MRKMRLSYLLLPVAAVFLSLCFSGCASQPRKVLLSPPRISEKLLDERSAELKKLLARFPHRILSFDPENLPAEVQFTNAQVFDRIEKMGFNELAVRFRSAELLEYPRVKEVVAEALSRKFKVYFILRQSFYVSTFRGNALARLFAEKQPTFEEMADKVAEFSRSLPDQGLSGLILELDPEKFNRTNSDRPADYVYTWSESTFGPGLDNDMMMKDALARFRAVKKKLSADLPVYASIADNCNDLVRAGKLTCGTPEQFLDGGELLFIRNSGNKSSESAKFLADELHDTKKADSLVVDFQLASHSSITKGAFRRRNWNDFVRSTRYLSEVWDRSESMGGIMVGPLITLIQIQREK